MSKCDGCLGKPYKVECVHCMKIDDVMATCKVEGIELQRYKYITDNMEQILLGTKTSEQVIQEYKERFGGNK